MMSRLLLLLQTLKSGCPGNVDLQSPEHGRRCDGLSSFIHRRLVHMTLQRPSTAAGVVRCR